VVPLAARPQLSPMRPMEEAEEAAEAVEAVKSPNQGQEDSLLASESEWNSPPQKGAPQEDSPQKEWEYVDDGGAQQGPFSQAKLRSWVMSGLLGRGHRVWPVGAAEARPISDWAELGRGSEQEAVAEEAREAVHTDIGCDVCDVCPIVGTRYRKLPASEADTDLCPACFCELPSAQQRAYEALDEPLADAGGGGTLPSNVRRIAASEVCEGDLLDVKFPGGTFYQGEVPPARFEHAIF
jgi:hypothetical protein